MPIRATTPLEPPEPLDLSPEERVELTFKRWKEVKGALSQRKAAEKHGVPRTTLQHRINAWAVTGLSPFDPQIVLKHFPPPETPEAYEQYNVTIDPTTPPEAVVSYIGKDGKIRVVMTPSNTLQVRQLLHQAKAEGIKPVEVLKKVSKATTNKLLALNKRRERKANRTKGNWGNARVMN
ncbi:hypothetical protein OEA41_010379 [Lepraria neglecta]|uniref:HTH psq-type domain-containing protein n=1 Tax=Lepraria neglecta TaxID=209136 RepID=A0AAD9YYY3_9LECA|nr:hypothetical protein OEA41_010379 [Lepraria neglecta]